MRADVGALHAGDQRFAEGIAGGERLGAGTIELDADGVVRSQQAAPGSGEVFFLGERDEGRFDHRAQGLTVYGCSTVDASMRHPRHLGRRGAMRHDQSIHGLCERMMRQSQSGANDGRGTQEEISPTDIGLRNAIWPR